MLVIEIIKQYVMLQNKKVTSFGITPYGPQFVVHLSRSQSSKYVDV